MNGFDAYATYNAFKLHFKSDTYDYFTFNGKTNLKIASYEKRRDRYQFEKIASRISKEKFLRISIKYKKPYIIRLFVSLLTNIQYDV